MRKPKIKSMTDWNKVRGEYDLNAPIPYDPEDGPYDPNDATAVKAYWDKARITHKGKVIRKGRGPQKAPTKERITIRLSPDVVDYYRSTGEGWQARMDEALRNSIKRKTAK